MIEDGAWVESWLSAPRFAVYLAAAGGDRLRALRLYEWNAAVSAALQHDLSHLEVGLRNAYDRALCDGRDDRERHWVFDADRLFPPAWQKAANGVRYDANKTTRKLLANAIRSAAGSTCALPPAGKVIAELSFGFWRYLSVKRHDQRLWIPYLHRAFRPGVARRAVDEPIKRLHRLRNRVAHHEPLLGIDLLARCDDVLALAGFILPEQRSYIAATSACAKLLTRCDRVSRP